MPDYNPIKPDLMELRYMQSNMCSPMDEQIAIQICEEIRQENKKKKWSFQKFACYMCKGRWCLKRGCSLVEKRFKQQENRIENEKRA